MAWAKAGAITIASADLESLLKVGPEEWAAV